MPPQTAQWASVAKPGPYTTTLAPAEEQQFKSWVNTNKVPWQDSPTADYDMRGFWKGLQSGDPTARTAINSVDNQIHYPDKWKTPYHQTFSNESQYATPNAGHWQGETFVPPATQSTAGARPKPSAWLAQQSPSDFLSSSEGQNPAAIQPPPAIPPHVLPNSERAVNAFNAQNPQSGPAVRLPLEAAAGFGQGSLGIPETQHPIMDMATGLWRTLTAPPATGFEKAAATSFPGVAPALITGKRAALGMAKTAYENVFKEGGPESTQGFANAYVDYKNGEPMTEDLAHGVHGLAKVLGTVLPLRELVGPPVVEAATAVDQGARGVVRDVSGAGPKVLAKQAGNVAEATADVGADNAKAVAEHTAANQAKIREANDANAAAAVEHLQKQTASDVNWEGETTGKMRQYFNDVAENEQAHAENTKQIQEANAKGQADVAHRQQVETELKGDHSANINGVRKAAGEDLADAKSQYPDLTNGGEKEMPAADEAQTLDQINGALGRTLKGSGNIPSSIRNVIADYTPAEGAEGGVMIDDELHGPGDPLFEQLKSEGKLRPEEMGTPGETPEKATADMLHGQMSEVMKEYMGASGDNRAALGAVGDVLRTQLRNLYKAEGRLPEFDAAQKNYAEVMKRYYDRSSPLSKLLNDRTSQAAFDPTGAGTGNVARPEVAERMLKAPGNAATVDRYLRDRHPDLADSFKATSAKMAERDALPKKFNPQQIPLKKEVPVPDLPLREELAAAKVKQPNLAPPPEAKPAPAPFDRQAFIKDKIQQTAESFKRVSPWETAAAIGAGGALLEKGVLPAMSAFSYPVVRYGIGRMIEHPAFQEWAAREGVTPPPGAPPIGAGAQPGAPTPFTPPPGSDIGARISELTAVRDQAAKTGTPQHVLDGMDKRIAEIDRRVRDVGQQGGADRRAPAGPPKVHPTATMEVPAEVAAKIKDAGLVSKGEVMPGSGVFQVEHPDFPGKTFSISATDAPADIARKLQAMRERFGK